MYRKSIGILAVIPAFFLGLSAAHAAESYQVDPIHSMIHFRVKHFGVGYIYGRFNEFSGNFNVDDGNLANASFDLQIKAESIDSNNQGRDKHLKNPDFFNTVEFPTINFKSTQVKEVDANNVEVTGDLTMHGVTKPVTMKMERIGAGKDPRGSMRMGWESIFDIKRSDFGMKSMLQGIGDDVRCIVAIEGVRK